MTPRSERARGVEAGAGPFFAAVIARQYGLAGTDDLLAREQAELEVVLGYLPRQISREEVMAAAQQVIAEVGAKGPQDTGKVMGKLMPQLKGKADGKMISEVVKELLTGQNAPL